MPWELIKPSNINIDEAVKSIPGLNNIASDILTEIIESQGIFRGLQQFGRHGTVWSKDNTSLIWISNFYRWVGNGTIQLRHLPYMPRFKGTMPGKNYLYDTLRGFDEISKIFHIDKSTLEKLKRYFILMLMGIIGNSELFHDNIEQMINTNIGRISELHDKAMIRYRVKH